MLRRSTARVLPVDRDGRVLLLIARGLFWRGEPYWLTVGGGLEPAETLAQAGVRELWEEAGIAAEAAALGGALGTSAISFTSFGLLSVTQYQTYFALPVEDTTVSFAHQGAIERRCVEGHRWLTAGELSDWPVRVADPELPRLMRAAVAAARRPGQRDL
jgi:8-oxo-dGTP pyrophosphatase MutT (NUDIX family)